MKLKRVSAIILALLLLSSCAANKDIKPLSTDDSASVTEQQTEQSMETTSQTTSEEITSVTESTTIPETEPSADTSESESEASQEEVLPSDEAETVTTVQEDEVLPSESESEEETVPDEESAGKGITTEGDEFDIDPDYAYFLVNRDIPLPDDYSIETDYIQGSYELETTAAYYCREMIEAAANDGIDLKVLSAYRTIKYQQKLFDRNVKSRMESGMTYDEAYADVLINIALPGTSEHNAGLAVDIITKRDWDTYEGFEDTEEFAWLQEHAHEYGFILRYLKGKEDITGYIYEPWHYRFIGVKYALDIKESGLCLEEYFEIHPQAY